MTELISYEAIDGVQFDNENECMDYEAKLWGRRACGMGVKVFDDEGNALDLLAVKDVGDAQEIIEAAAFIYIPTEDAFEVFEEFIDAEGIVGGKGEWYLNGDCDWCETENLRNQYQKLVSIFGE